MCCHRHCHCDCCEIDEDVFVRRYQTKAERIAELEAYREELKKELQAVEELLSDLQK